MKLRAAILSATLNCFLSPPARRCWRLWSSSSSHHPLLVPLSHSFASSPKLSGLDATPALVKLDRGTMAFRATGGETTTGDADSARAGSAPRRTETLDALDVRSAISALLCNGGCGGVTTATSLFLGGSKVRELTLLGLNSAVRVSAPFPCDGRSFLPASTVRWRSCGFIR